MLLTVLYSLFRKLRSPFIFPRREPRFHEKSYFFHSSIQLIAVPAILKAEYQGGERYTEEDQQEYNGQIVEVEARVKVLICRAIRSQRTFVPPFLLQTT